MTKIRPSIESKILEALKTYQWKKHATMLRFSMHINHSEGFVRKKIQQLVNEGRIVRVKVDFNRSKTQYIYKLVEQDEV